MSIWQSLLKYDSLILRWVNYHSWSPLDYLLGLVSYVGEGGLDWVILCLVLFIIGKKEAKLTALLCLIAIAIADLGIGHSLRIFWNRPRPYQALDDIRQIGLTWQNGSFPSAHANSSVAATVVLGTKYRKTLPFLVFFVLLTCYSRPYFGMHYPLDVLVGALIGLFSGWLVLYLEALWRRRRKRIAEPKTKM